MFAQEEELTFNEEPEVTTQLRVCNIKRNICDNLSGYNSSLKYASEKMNMHWLNLIGW